jgi:hypothetical protein
MKYYFHVHEINPDEDRMVEDGRFDITVTNANYFDSNKCVDDEHMKDDDLRKKLEDAGFDEVMESAWQYWGNNMFSITYQELIKFLISLGLVESKEFSKLMEENYSINN